MFDPNSRYANLAQYPVVDARGRMVSVVPVPPRPNEKTLGYHVLREGERMDHLAARYLSDPAAFWRIAELNDVMLAEDLTEHREIAIPGGNL
jgi:hypothetical protein